MKKFLVYSTEVDMQLTPEMLTRFIGGQMEIHNDIERYILRGEIATASIEDEILTVRFAWLARGEGYPPIPLRWLNEQNLDYSLTMMAGFTNVQTDELGRIIIESMISSELIVLFPVTYGRKLDRSKVEGLDAVSA